MPYRILVLPLLLFCSCGTPAGPQNNGQTNGIRNSNDNRDTLVITYKAAVYYQPDSARIAQAKSENEADFYTAADDNLYYMQASRKFLDSIHMTILDAKGKKFLKFVLPGNQHTIIKLDTLTTLWGLYFFDGVKPPQEADMTTPDISYSDYFKH